MESSDGPSPPTSRTVGQVCDRCRRRKIRCHGSGEECSPCYMAGVVCVKSAKLKRARKRKSYYESEGIEQRRPDQSAELTTGQTQGYGSFDSLGLDMHSVSPTDLQLRPSVSTPSQGGYASEQAAHGAQISSGATPPMVRTATGARPKSDQVIGHMGRLVSDDQQIAMFAGSSTGVHFISQAEQQLQMCRMHNEPFPRCAYGLHLHSLWDVRSHPTDESTLVQSVIAGLPGDVLEVLEVAIDRWTPIYPIIHKPSFMETSTQLLNGEAIADGIGVVVLYQILSLLALGFIGHPGPCDRHHFHFLCYSESYYGMTTTLLDHVLGKPCLQTLQGLELVQIYLQLSSRYSTALHIGGVATRLAQNLGLHRHSNRFKFDPLETELRRRVWWCQFSLDAFSSAYHGMPRLIRDQDVDTDLPTRVDHDLLSRSHVAFPLPGEASQVDTALLLFKLGGITGQTLEKLYTTTQRRGGLSKIERLQAELDMWERSLPDTQQHEGGTDEIMDGDSQSWPKMTLATMFLRAAHCVATLHINRPALAFTTPHPQFEKSLATCCRASANLIRVLSPGLLSLSAGSGDCPDALFVGLLYPNGAHMFWQAGLTILFSRWKGLPHSADPEEDDELSRRCVESLRQLQTATDNAERNDIAQCAEVLELLRLKTFHPTTSTPPPQADPDQLQWNVWDWPMESALELANTLDVMPLDLYM